MEVSWQIGRAAIQVVGFPDALLLSAAVADYKGFVSSEVTLPVWRDPPGPADSPTGLIG